MRRGPSLTTAQHCILEQLARVQYATRPQLAYWCGVTVQAISTSAQGLFEQSLIDGSLFSRPMIWGLTHAGGKVLDISMPSGGRASSWSVMAHACHLNAIEITFAKQHPGFRIVSRKALLKRGLNPAFGEHAAVDASGNTWFVLLDDYMMPSYRIARSWMRRHTPNLKYWPDHTGRAWSEVAHLFLVVSTDTRQAERHITWIEKKGIPAHVSSIQALWKI